MKLITEKLSPADLEAINKLTMTEMSEDDLFTFSAKAIDDEPTANGRIWSVEWQRANVENFVGAPVTINHENNQALVLGRIYGARQKDKSIFVKVYVPLNTEVGREAKQKIDAGLFKSVSINGTGDMIPEGDLTRVMPGKNDRVFEVSFVAVGGCRTCQIISECACQNTGKSVKADNSESSAHDKWIDYARTIHANQSAEFVRLAGFAIGENFQIDTYKEIAARLDPEALKAMSDDYRRLCEDRKASAEGEGSAAAQVTEAISKIKKMKGI